MRAQTYTDPVAVSRMRAGRCPECGDTPEKHVSDGRFWAVPRDCTLLPRGVTDRIEWQRELDEGGTP